MVLCELMSERREQGFDVVEFAVIPRKEEAPAENTTTIGPLGDRPSDRRLANSSQAIQPKDAGSSGDVAVNPLSDRL